MIPRPLQSYSAKSCFGSNVEPDDAGNYILNKKKKLLNCKASKCSNKNIIYTFNNYDLNSSLYTKLDLSYVCTVEDLSNNICATKIDFGASFINTYFIDPNGSLFGNSPCGINNFLQYRIYNPPSKYSGIGFDLSFQGQYYVFIFKNDGNISFYGENLTINYIIVGGGGGGGAGVIGGGGAGGGGGGGNVEYSTIMDLDAPLFSVKVGNGGNPGLTGGTPTSGQSGQSSSIIGSINVTTLGGFGGINGSSIGGNGGNSGSGGLGGLGGTVGGNGTNGGGGAGGGYFYGGGNGSNNSLSNPSFMNTINQYGAGGGGGNGDGGGGPGSGGNNAGGGGPNSGSPNGVTAIANYGGGGGGGASGNGIVGTSGNGGYGGSGIVIFYVVL